MTKRGATGHMLLSNRFLKVTIHDLSVMEQTPILPKEGKDKAQRKSTGHRGHHETKATVENSMGGGRGTRDGGARDDVHSEEWTKAI